MKEIKVNIKSASGKKNRIIERAMLFDESVSTVRELILSAVQTCVDEYNQRLESSELLEVLSEFVKKEYGNVADLLVPAEFIPDFYRACDDMVRFQYARSYWRRSYRSLDAFSHAQRIFELMNMYYLIGRFGLKPGGLKPVVCDVWDDNKNRSIYLSLNMTDLFIAERVNAGDEEVTCLLKDMIPG